MIKPWQWTHEPAVALFSRETWRLKDGRGRERATVWANSSGFTWHTWDENGVGGENDTVNTSDDAKRHAVASIVRQGWAPGGWTVQW